MSVRIPPCCAGAIWLPSRLHEQRHSHSQAISSPLARGRRPSPVVAPLVRPPWSARLADAGLVWFGARLGRLARRSSGVVGPASAASLSRLPGSAVPSAKRLALLLRSRLPRGLSQNARFGQRQPAGRAGPGAGRRRL